MKRGGAVQRTERFRSLRAEFTKLVRRFESTEEPAERRRLIKAARCIIEEARFAIEQNLRERAERVAEQVIEIQERTKSASNGMRAKRQDGRKSRGHIVPFRLQAKRLMTPFGDRDEADTAKESGDKTIRHRQ
jgi:hypothetical protein